METPPPVVRAGTRLLDEYLTGTPGVADVPADSVLALMLDASDAGLWLWDPRSDQVRWSPEARRILGLSPGESANTAAAFFDRVAADDRERLRESIGKAVREQATCCAGFRVVHGDGSTHRVLNRGRASYDSRGAAGTFVGTLTEAAASGTTRRLAMDAAGMSPWQADVDQGVLEFSDGAAALHGTSRSTWMLDDGIEFIVHADRARIAGLLRDAAGSGGRVEAEYRTVLPDGTSRWIALFARATLDGQGCPTGRLNGVVRDVTGRHLAEVGRERDRALLDAVLQAMPAGVIIADPVGRLLRWNEANQVLWGLRGVEPTQTVDIEAYVDWKGWWYPDGEPLGPHDWAMARALERGERVSGDVVEIERFDGSGRRVIVNMGAPVFDRAGALLGAVVVQTDITAGVHAEKAMRASEARLRQIIDSMFAFVGMIRPDGTLTEVNRAPLEIAGLARGDVVGRKFWDCAWWTHDEAVRTRLADAFARAAAGEVVRYDEVIRVADDRRMTIDFLLQPVFEDGQLVCVIPSGVDVTARQRMEANLRVSERRFRVAVEATSGIIWSNDLTGRMSGDQPGWAAFTGQSREEYEGFGWAAAVHPEDTAPTLRAWQDAVAAGSRFEFEHRVRRHDGEYRRFQIRALPVRGHDGVAREWVGVHTDITDIRAASEALEEADRRKDVFLATLSHELRNPLAPIRTAARLLGNPRLDAAQTEWVQAVIQRQVKQMSRLLDDLLDVSRITRSKLSLKPDLIGLASVVDTAVESVRPLMDSRRHRLTVTLPPDPVALCVDAVRLAQILANLLGNAAKYTEPGGVVDLVAQVEGEWLVVAIRDNGVGLAPEVLPNLFQMFTQLGGPTVGREDGGLGIGLALVKALVELHRGTIEASSAGAGKGSTFTIRLPVVRQDV